MRIKGIFLLIFFGYCVPNHASEDVLKSIIDYCNDPVKHSQVVIGEDLFENNKIFVVDNNSISVAQDENFLYLLAKDELILIKTDLKGKPLYRYQAKRGQGPGDMLTPKSVSFFGNGIAVLDANKSSIIFFTKDLQYENEKIVPSSIERLSATSRGDWVAWKKSEKNYAALYDKEMNLIRDFGAYDVDKVPYKGVFRLHTERVYLTEASVILTSWIYFKPECRLVRADVYDKGDPVQSVWENPENTTENDFLRDRNIYQSIMFVGAGEYIIGHFRDNKILSKDYDDSILIFDKKGKCVFEQRDISFEPLNATFANGAANVYMIREGSLERVI